MRAQWMGPDDGLQVLASFMVNPHEAHKEHVQHGAEEVQHPRTVQRIVCAKGVEDRQVDSHKTQAGSHDQPEFQQNATVLGDAHHESNMHQDHHYQTGSNEREQLIRLVVVLALF